MSVRTLWMALFVLIVIPLASAEVIWNKTFDNTADIDLGGETYALKIGSGNITSIVISKDNDSLFIKEGKCTYFGSELFCHEEKLDDEKARLSLTDMTASIELDFELDETSVLVGDEIEGFFSLEHLDGENAHLLAFMNVPDNCTVVSSKKCSFNGSYLVFDKTVYDDDFDYCNFTLRADGIIDAATMNVYAHYSSFEPDWLWENSSSITLSSDFVFPINISVDNISSIEPGMPFVISVSARNDVNEDVNFSMRIDIDGGKYAQSAVVSSFGKTSNKADKYFSSISYEKDVSFSSTFQIPDINVSDVLTVTIMYSDEDGENHTFEKSFPYSTSAKQFLMWSSPTKLSFEAGVPSVFNVSFANPYETAMFTAYRARVSSPLLKNDVYTTIPYVKSRTIPLIFVAPDEPGSHDVLLSVSARNQEGEWIDFERVFDVTITSLANISLSQNYSSKKPGVLSVHIFATNSHQRPVKVSFEELLPDGLFAKGDLTSFVDLPVGEKTEVLSFDIAIDEIPQENLRTEYSYSYIGITHSDNFSFFLDTSETLSVPVPLPELENNSSHQSQFNSSLEQDPNDMTDDNSPKQYNWFLFAIIGVLIVVVAAMVKFVLPHMHKPKHRKNNVAQKRYLSLEKESEEVKINQKNLKKKEEYVKDEMKTVSSFIKEYDKTLPIHINRVEKQKSKISHLLDHAKKRKFALDSRIHTLQEKSNEIKLFEDRLQAVIAQLNKKESLLRGDETELVNDLSALSAEKKQIIAEQVQKAARLKSLTENIHRFRSEHKNQLDSMVTHTSQRRAETQKLHKQLEIEERHLRKELNSVEDDLRRSEKEVAEAEKIYKETSIGLEHESTNK